MKTTDTTTEAATTIEGDAPAAHIGYLESEIRNGQILHTAKCESCTWTSGQYHYRKDARARGFKHTDKYGHQA